MMQFRLPSEELQLGEQTVSCASISTITQDSRVKPLSKTAKLQPNKVLFYNKGHENKEKVFLCSSCVRCSMLICDARPQDLCENAVIVNKDTNSTVSLYLPNPGP